MNLSWQAKKHFIRSRQWFGRHKRLSFLIGDIMLLLSAAWLFLPLNEREVRRSQVDMEIDSYYEIIVDGKPMLYFSNIDDSMNFTGGAVTDSTIITTKTRAPGYWVNDLPIIPSCYGRIMTLAAPQPNKVVRMDSTELQRYLFRQVAYADNKLAGLQHMQNELHYYKKRHDIADFGYTRIIKYMSEIDQQVDSLQSIVDTLLAMRHAKSLKVRYVSHYTLKQTTYGHDTLNSTCAVLKDYKGQFCLVQTRRKTTPESIETRLSKGKGMELLLETTYPAKHKDSISTKDGMKVTTIVIDSVGTYVGQASADSLSEGKVRPNGIGNMYYNDGSFYEGGWTRGKRNGFGFYVSPHDYLQAGTWKFDVFKGERLIYNASRIYGIDLSRHQHEKDGKRYSIDWSHLRITDLGSATNKTVDGTVDYPVSYIYIKSTEGCTVYNSYYNADYAMAHKKGIHVGAYHFFSTTSSGSQQAWTFLRKTRIQNGDLAPVLDVEPTEQQIKKMGGTKVLLSNVRQWLSIVYKQTGQRPIIYAGQNFANKYLTQAPDIIGNHLVWIARYGEYKPSMKLAIWQLSSDGKVKGIHGKVDINVFSGYKEQFEDFIKNHTIKK